METMIMVGLGLAFVFVPAFRVNVGRTMNSANRVLETANNALEAGLDEIEQSLPKASKEQIEAQTTKTTKAK